MPEPSVLVLGIDFNKAFEIARRFEQNAFVFAEKGKPPMLINSKQGAWLGSIDNKEYS